MEITQNRTRYSTEDLQDLLEAVHACRGKLSKSRNYRTQRRHGTAELEVGYWKGNPAESREWGKVGGRRSKSHGPWFTPDPMFTKTDRVLVLNYPQLLAAMSDLEALALAGKAEAVLPDEAKLQIATLMATRLGYGVSNRLYGSRRGQETTKALADVLGGQQMIQAVNIHVLDRVQDPKPKGDPQAYLNQLEETFRRGGAATDLAEGRRAIFAWTKAYHKVWPKTEIQRKRVLDRGGLAEPHPTTVEMLEAALAWAKEQT